MIADGNVREATEPEKRAVRSVALPWVYGLGQSALSKSRCKALLRSFALSQQRPAGADNIWNSELPVALLPGLTRSNFSRRVLCSLVLTVLINTKWVTRPCGTATPRSMARAAVSGECPRTVGCTAALEAARGFEADRSKQ